MNEKVKNVAWLAAPCVGLGVFLVNQGYRKAGWACVIVAGAIVLSGFLSVVVPPLGRALYVLALPIRAAVRVGMRSLRRVQVWLVRKLVVPALAGPQETDAGMLCWTAGQVRGFVGGGGLGADYLNLEAPPDHRLRGLEFSVRPDYQFGYWRAGFRLGAVNERLEDAGITNGFLFHLWSNAWGEQTQMMTYSSGQASQPTGLPQYAHQARTPTYVVSANLWRIPNTTRVRISVSANGVNLQAEADIDASLAGRLLLVGWADGRQFRIHFDDIHIFWAPYNE